MPDEMHLNIAFKYYNNMGQRNSKSQAPQLTPENISQATKYLFQTDPAQLSADSLSGPISIISRQLQLQKMFEKTEQGFRVSPLLLNITHQADFARSLTKIVQLLVAELRGIISARVLALVPRDKFSRCVSLANFAIFLTDQTMLKNINLLNARTDLDPQTQESVSKWAKEDKEVPSLVLEQISSEELAQSGKILRLSIGFMIDLHLKLLTRSDYTLTIVDSLNQACLALYCKFFFSDKRDFSKRQRTENGKALVRMGAYFVGFGIEWSLPSVYQLGVLLVEASVNGNEAALQGKALPSHLFKTLPIVNNNQMMNWLAVALLFQLKYITKDGKVFHRLNINRIPSLRLLQKIVKIIKNPTQQLTFMVEQLCQQTKPSQIQRVYVCSIAAAYSSLQKVDSQILRLFNQGKDLAYNVKTLNRQKRVKPQDVRTELQDEQSDIQRECVGLIGKYITHVVLKKKDVMYEYSDKALWNVILKNLDQEGTMKVGNTGELKEPDDE